MFFKHNEINPDKKFKNPMVRLLNISLALNILVIFTAFILLGRLTRLKEIMNIKEYLLNPTIFSLDYDHFSDYHNSFHSNQKLKKTYAKKIILAFFFFILVISIIIFLVCKLISNKTKLSLEEEKMLEKEIMMQQFFDQEDIMQKNESSEVKPLALEPCIKFSCKGKVFKTPSDLVVQILKDETINKKDNFSDSSSIDAKFDFLKVEPFEISQSI